MKEKHILNPFTGYDKMNWNIWHPNINRMNYKHLPKNGSFCLMLNRKTGMVYMKEAESVTVVEWCQGAGHDAVIAIAHEKECF